MRATLLEIVANIADRSPNCSQSYDQEIERSGVTVALEVLNMTIDLAATDFALAITPRPMRLVVRSCYDLPTIPNFFSVAARS